MAGVEGQAAESVASLVAPEARTITILKTACRMAAAVALLEPAPEQARAAATAEEPYKSSPAAFF
jgi:hypothetical protein